MRLRLLTSAFLTVLCVMTAAPGEGIRYLCYTERDSLDSFTAESLVKEFYDPQAVQHFEKERV